MRYKQRWEDLFFILFIFYILFLIFFSIDLEIPDFSLLEENTKKEIYIQISKGFLEKYFFTSEIYEDLYPQIIDQELITRRLFQTLSQEIKKNLIIIYLYLFIIIFIIFYLIAKHYRVSFVKPYRNLILLTMIIYLFNEYFFILRDEIIRYYKLHPHYFIFLKSILNNVFLLGGTFLLFKKESITVEQNFLNFYFLKKYELTSRFLNSLKTIFHFFIIAILSIFIVNLLLFPIFFLQIHFNLPFHYLFILIIIFLIYFYVHSYYKLSVSRNENPNLWISFSFLAFKILQNLFIIISFLIFALILINLIMGLTVLNLKFLEVNSLIPRNVDL